MLNSIQTIDGQIVIKRTYLNLKLTFFASLVAKYFTTTNHNITHIPQKVKSDSFERDARQAKKRIMCIYIARRRKAYAQSHV